jgi:processive 1,2-diacylglycerol beta-glucosyltransferase
MFQLYDSERRTQLGRVDEAQLQVLIDHLEETAPTDQDYYIDAPTLDMLEDAGAGPDLLNMLRTALGDRDGFEVRWEAVE